jgi:hypothetical protein
MNCTRFKSLRNTKPLEVTSLLSVLNEIASDKYKVTIDQIRSEADPSKSRLKDRLPVFTPTGQFNYRSIKGLEEYNGIICLDIDHIEDPESLKDQCKSLDYVYSAFITPSGRGLKVIIKTDATSENYRNIELMVSEKFLQDTGASRDNHCKDIARIQFVSYDPDLYINESAKTLIYE